MRKISLLFIFIILFSIFVSQKGETCVFASPFDTLINENHKEEFMSNISQYIDDDIEKAYKVLDDMEEYNIEVIWFLQKQFDSFMTKYQEHCLKIASDLFEKKEYNLCVDFLEGKNIFFEKHSGYNTILEKYKKYLINENLEEYKGEIVHFFTHCLISNPGLAFSSSNNMSKIYDRDCITVTEFKNFLKEMYDNDYVLIDIDKIRSVDKDNKALKSTLYLPKGKKPLILSFDDVNYDSKKMNRGMVDKIILAPNNKIASYTEKSDNQISYDNEFITVLENFIYRFPDFAFDNARGIICLTGYDGVFGYRTQSGSINRVGEIEKAKQLASKLKENGWKFASHSYGHYHLKNISATKLIEEIQLFSEEVESIVGKTDIFVFPYGENDISPNKGASEKLKLLVDGGFNTFFGVGEKTYFQCIFKNDTKYSILMMDRKPLDGFSLRSKKIAYQKYFDCYKIFDHKNRTIPYD